jgi:hypothetical protein
MDPVDRARFEAASLHWRTLVAIQLVEGHRTLDPTKSGVERDLYVLRDDEGEPLMMFSLEAPSGWTLVWSIGQAAPKPSLPLADFAP